MTEPGPPDKMIKILFVTAEPSDAGRLRLGKEFREIRDALHRNALGPAFTLSQSPATRPTDFIQAMIDGEPDIVHFSGHGSDGGLWLENDAGEASPASAGALALMFEQFRDKTRCVVLNACWSRPQAKAIAPHARYVIGTKSEISDAAAIAFATGFYQGMGSDRDVPKAFNLGCANMELTEPDSRGIMVLMEGSRRVSRRRIPKLDVDRTPATAGMTRLTGVCFISYKRDRLHEITKLVSALHDHGVPTWQDLRNLDHTHTEQRVIQVLEDPGTASAVLWTTPEVEHSKMIGQVEAPAIIKRAKANDGFFFLPVLAGGLGVDDIPKVIGPRYTREDLRNWNLRKLDVDPITDKEAADLAEEILDLRVREIHKALPKDHPLRIEVYTRPPAVVNNDVALIVDWTERFDDREARPGAWDEFVLPSIRSIVHAVASRAPGRSVELSGNLAIPAAVALGIGFMAPRGINVTWKQLNPPPGAYQYWNLSAQRQPSGYKYELERGTVGEKDLAVLVSVPRDVEAAFYNTPDLPAFRAFLRVKSDAKETPILETPGQAIDVARAVIEGIEEARTNFQLGTVHLFMAVPVGLAFMIGQLLNGMGAVQVYEMASNQATGAYRPAVVLSSSGGGAGIVDRPQSLSPRARGKRWTTALGIGDGVGRSLAPPLSRRRLAWSAAAATIIASLAAYVALNQHPQILITKDPPSDPTGQSKEEVEGRVTGVDPRSFLVVIYTCTHDCRVQSSGGQPFVEIDSDGTWRSEVYTGSRYVALLVKRSFQGFGEVLSRPPEIGGDVLAVKEFGEPR